MKWESPRNDGGSRVLSYELEARLWRENNWFKVGEDRLLLNRLEARGPYEVGHHYAIRVRAINAAGAGPWSIDSDELICKYKALKPKVTFRGVAAKEVVTFKAGETLAFEVDIEGEPPAHDVVWSLGGKELNEAPGNGIKIDNNKPYKSFLVKDSLTRRDQGALLCTATNMEGKASTGIEVVVVSKPAMPSDRLLVSNISKTGCRLNWQAPADDGGLPLEYIIEKYTQASDSWMVHVSHINDIAICKQIKCIVLHREKRMVQPMMCLIWTMATNMDLQCEPPTLLVTLTLCPQLS